MIIDKSAKVGDPHEQDKAKSNGEELKFDLDRPLTAEEKEIFAKLKEGLQM
jgi:hypothetical protein